MFDRKRLASIVKEVEGEFVRERLVGKLICRLSIQDSE